MLLAIGARLAQPDNNAYDGTRSLMIEGEKKELGSTSSAQDLDNVVLATTRFRCSNILAPNAFSFHSRARARAVAPTRASRSGCRSKHKISFAAAFAESLGVPAMTSACKHPLSPNSADAPMAPPPCSKVGTPKAAASTTVIP
eukprot:scaffold3567_cov26-Tisochrysis_lutea.AAC.1